jgi:PPOX class probable F420-dependent enzyme
MAAFGPRTVALIERRNYATLSCFDRDGTMRHVVVWANVEGGRLLLNSARGRVWPADLERDPRLTVSIFDRRNPAEYVEIRGTARLDAEGEEARRHVDRLSAKYLGVESYPNAAPGEERIRLAVDAERIRHVGAPAGTG